MEEATEHNTTQRQPKMTQAQQAVEAAKKDALSALELVKAKIEAVASTNKYNWCEAEELQHIAARLSELVG